MGAHTPTKKLSNASSTLVVPRLPIGPSGIFALRRTNVTFWKNARRNAGPKMKTKMLTISFHLFSKMMCDPMYKPAPTPATIKQISVQKYQGSMSLSTVDKRYVTSYPESAPRALEIR
jgi:hypothetical protein